jgi:photosystem II stability/assembly factor-like uncharacterized protein
LPDLGVFSLAINSSGHIFAGTSRGLIRSTDDGGSWTVVDSNAFVGMLAISANNNIFAATQQAGLIRSTDNGDSWTDVNNGLMNAAVSSLTFNANGDLLAGTNRGQLFFSVNNGDSWTEASVRLTNNAITSLVINSNGHILVGTYGSGIFRSRDNGTSWASINSGLANTSIKVLALTTEDYLFAGTAGGGVFRSTVPSSVELPPPPPPPEFWQKTTQHGTGYIYSLAINQNGHVFSGTGGSGVYRSTDNGDSWISASKGILLNLTAIQALAVNDSGHLFAGITSALFVGSGVYRSKDNGENWTLVTTALGDLGVYDVAIIKTSGYIFINTNNGRYHSTDNGQSWQWGIRGLGGISEFTIAANGDVLAPSGSTIYRSTDHGWTAMPLNVEVYSLALHPQGQLFAGTQHGLLVSKDNGASWAPVNSSLNNIAARYLAINTSGHIFVVTRRGETFRSRDNGDSWVQVSDALPDTEILCFGINPNDYLFAGTSGDGVFRSAAPTTAVTAGPQESVPSAYTLEQNYPNPFWSATSSRLADKANTTIAFSLPRPSYVTLKVYNLLGNEVATLVAGNLSAGKHEVKWGASLLASGFYLYRLEAEGFAQTRKLLLMK